MNRARAVAAAIVLVLAPVATSCAFFSRAPGNVVGQIDTDGVGKGSAAMNASGGTAGTAASENAQQPSFWSSFSAPLWTVLIINIASLVAAGTSAWAALRTNPRTAREVANQQAEVARSAVAASAASAEAAREAAAASTLNARTAATATANQGVHAIARLRQEWIDELRSQVAEAHALLANPAAKVPLVVSAPAQAQAELDYRRRANEAVTKIDLMLNPNEEASRALTDALDAMNQPDLNLAERRTRGTAVRIAAKAILKGEWDRVRGELKAGPITTD